LIIRKEGDFKFAGGSFADGVQSLQSRPILEAPLLKAHHCGLALKAHMSSCNPLDPESWSILDIALRSWIKGG